MSEEKLKVKRLSRVRINPIGRFSVPYSKDEDEVLNLASKYSNKGYNVVIHKRGCYLEVSGEQPRSGKATFRGSVATESNKKLHQKMQDVEKQFIDTLSSLEIQLYELSQEMDEIKRKSYKDRFLMQSGAKLNDLQQEYPVRVYLEKDENTSDVECAVAALVDQLDSSFIEDYVAVSGSWFKEWVAKTKTNQWIQKELTKARKAIEVKTIGVPQSEIDKNYSDSIANLLGSIKGQDNAAIQVGALLLVKYKNSNSESQVATKILNIDQLISLEENPQWLGEPGSLIEKLQINSQESPNRLTSINK